MTRTEALRRVLNAELDMRRGELDGGDPLSSLTIVVNMDERADEPGAIVWRPESRRKLRGCEPSRNGGRATVVD